MHSPSFQERDPIGFALVEKGYVGNEFLLNNNGAVGIIERPGLEVGGIWTLPSRLLQFPVETHARGPGGARSIGLMHPRLVEHPFVQRLYDDLKLPLAPSPALNDCGFTKSRTALWWHACDLASLGLWDELLATAQLTTNDYIAQAVTYALTWRTAKPADQVASMRKLREVLAFCGSDEPSDTARSLKSLARPRATVSEKGSERWMVQTGQTDYPASAWAMIHGLENGWLEGDHGRYLVWTKLGRSRYEQATNGIFVESTGQACLPF